MGKPESNLFHNYHYRKKSARYSTRKEYAILRTGGKDGVVPRILCSLGDTVVCKKCMNEFVEAVRKWIRIEVILGVAVCVLSCALNVVCAG